MQDAAADPNASPGLLGRIAGLWFSPRETFVSILGDPRIWIALAVFIALNLAFTVVWMQKVDPAEFLKVQLEESGQLEKIPAESRAGVIETQAGFFPVFAWLGGLVFAPLFILLVALVLWLVFRFAFSGNVAFKQAVGIALHAVLATSVVTVPLTLLTLFLKGDWNINPQEAIGANLGLLLDKSTTAPWLYHIASSLDLFNLWLVFLLASGFAVATKRATGSAFWGVAIPWLIVVLCVAAWKAVF